MREATIRQGRFSYIIICADCRYLAVSCAAEPINESIIIYNNLEAAKDSGWHQTNHPMFCGGSNQGSVWLCPECSKKYNKQLIRYKK